MAANYSLLSQVPQAQPADYTKAVLGGINAGNDAAKNMIAANQNQQQLDMQKPYYEAQTGQLNFETKYKQMETLNKLAASANPEDPVSWQQTLKQAQQMGLSLEGVPTTAGPEAKAFRDRAFQVSGQALEQLKIELEKTKLQRELTQPTYNQSNTTTVIDPQTGQQKLVPIDQAINGGIPVSDPKKQSTDFDNTSKLRTEFINQSKDFAQVNDSMNRIKASAVDPSPAGDLALIFNYMKMLDPGSTVREGEFANAQNSGGVDDKTVSLYNSIVNGQRLSENQRKDFLNRSGGLFKAQQTSQNQRESQYEKLAKQNGLDPENVIIDYTGDRAFKGLTDSSGKEVSLEMIDSVAKAKGLKREQVVESYGLKKISSKTNQSNAGTENVPDVIKKIAPNAKPDLVQPLTQNQDVLDKYGINTPERKKQFYAQVIHETAGLSTLNEKASGRNYEGRTDLGNKSPGDGPRYKGRGYIQLTGRSNYKKYGDMIGVDLVSNPELAADPKVAVELAAAYWADHGLNSLADNKDIRGITRKINGGLNGFAHRKSIYASL